MCECLVNWVEFIISVKYEGSVLSWMKVLTEMVVYSARRFCYTYNSCYERPRVDVYTPSLQLGEGKRYFAG